MEIAVMADTLLELGIEPAVLWPYVPPFTMPKNFYFHTLSQTFYLPSDRRHSTYRRARMRRGVWTGTRTERMTKREKRRAFMGYRVYQRCGTVGGTCSNGEWTKAVGEDEAL